MGNLLDKKEKIEIEDEVLSVDKLKEQRDEVEDEVVYKRRLANSDNFQKHVLKPMQMEVKRLSNINLAELDLERKGVKSVTDEIAAKALRNQGEINALNKIINLFTKS